MDSHSFLPQVTWHEYLSLKRISWEMIDDTIEQELGLKGLSIPSIRVGICWILEYLGYSRPENYILVPKYLSRCVLNAINRYAFPVRDITPQTNIVLLVNDFGFKHRVDKKELALRNLIYIEDSPFGISYKEEVMEDSYGKLIGFPKLLPILKGAFFMTHNRNLLDFIKRKRDEKKPHWPSWFIFMVMSRMRSSKVNIGYSLWADLAYEMYLESPRDNMLLLNNFNAGIKKVKEYSNAIKERISFTRDSLGEKILYPDADRLAYALLLLPGTKTTEFKHIFYRNNFDSTLYHFDMNRNIFNPDYKEVFLIPLNPSIPMKVFHNLINEIGLLV